MTPTDYTLLVVWVGFIAALVTFPSWSFHWLFVEDAEGGSR